MPAAIVTLMIIAALPALGMAPNANALEERQEPTCTDGFGSKICVFLHPGVEDAYKPGWSHTLGTLWDKQAGDGAQRRQVFDRYLDYAILASGSDSIGDLQFDIQVLEPIHYIYIYVPPEFKWLAGTAGEGIWTDITNDYMFIRAGQRSVYDSTAPNWMRVLIGGNFTRIEPGIHHIRLFNLRAPEVAGLYHFKIYVDGASIGADNFPFLIVKTELNPAYAEVLVRTNAFGGPDVSCVQPDGTTAPCPYVSGWVHAEGTTPEGRAVEGVAYWGPMEFLETSLKPGEYGSLYHVYLFGLAAGTYTFTAEASGFNPGVAERVVLSAGQSMHTIFILLYDSPDASVTIYSKHGTGEIPWHNLWQLPYGTNNPAAMPDDDGPRRDILIELYDSAKNRVAYWGSSALPLSKSFPISNMLIGLHDEGAPSPTHTSYRADLVDNYDLLGNVRMYPSTHWDGHVPWDTGDYIAGMPAGQYTVEAFVTGYVMDEPDAYQRTFTVVGSNIGVLFDLRRSNWIEIAMHMPSGVNVSGDTTVTLTAEDAAGNERGAAAFTATPEMISDPDDYVYDGRDALFASASTPNWEYYEGGIVIEGWNVLFPNFEDITVKDYGLNPTMSTHSAGAVSLAGNPYTIKLYMTDMGLPYEGVEGTGWYSIVGADPQVSVFLCNSAESLSFSIDNAWVRISLRSVDFQVPAHSRPWTFPGSEIWVVFLDEKGTAVDYLDPTVYGLIQDPDGVTPFDVDNVNDAGRHEHLAVNYYGMDWCRPGIVVAGFDIPVCLVPGYRPTRIPPGEYTYNVYTHGYLMRRSFPVQIPLAGGADIQADLIQGGQIRVMLEFRHEGEATPFNGFVRVEVFNEAGDLVGASIYGQAEPNIFTRAGGGAGGGYLDYDETQDWMLASVYGYTPSGLPEPAQATGFDESYDVYPSASRAQRAHLSLQLYGVPSNTWASWTEATAYGAGMSPADANRLLVPAGQVQTFDTYGFYWYYGDAARTWAGGWPTTSGSLQYDYGLRGSMEVPGWPDSGGGLYTVKVWAFDPSGPDGEFEAEGASDDWRMYSMASELTNVEVPWGGAQELFMTMNNMASLRGTVRWFDMFGNLISLPWAQVTASPGPDTDSIPAYSAGYGGVGAGVSDPSGGYIMWLPAGSHDVSVSTSEAPQVWSSSAPTSNMDYTVVVADGWVGGGDTQLAESGVPVPELPSALIPISLLAAVAASAWSLRRRRVVKIGF